MHMQVSPVVKQEQREQDHDYFESDLNKSEKCQKEFGFLKNKHQSKYLVV